MLSDFFIICTLRIFISKQSATVTLIENPYADIHNLVTEKWEKFHLALLSTHQGATRVVRKKSPSSKAPCIAM
jgi:hypothetical protein